jgi:hypothetical protein
MKLHTAVKKNLCGKERIDSLPLGPVAGFFL